MMRLDGIGVALDPALTRGWFRARNRHNQTQLLRFGADWPLDTISIDVGPEHYGALRETFIADDEAVAA